MLIGTVLGLLILSEKGIAYFPSSPIRINSNSDFQIGMNGVTGGSGSSGDPYVISAWDINAGSSEGIYIGNTTVHFVISNVYVHTADSPPFYPAIHFYNVANGRINNSILSGNLSYCAYVEQSSSIYITHNNMSGRFVNAVYANTVDGLTISQNDFYECLGYGVIVNSSNNTIISQNDFIRTSNPAFVMTTTNSSIHANEVKGRGTSGLWVAAVDNASITHNNITNEFRGIFFSGTSYDVLVQGNTVTDVDYAIISQNAYRVIIRDNVVNDSDNAGDWGTGSYGLYLDRATHAKVWNNTMIHCGILMHGQTRPEYNTHTISTNNTVNGRPILYFKDQSNVVVDGQEVGEVLLANCTTVSCSNLQISDSDAGLVSAFSTNITVSNCNFSDNSYAQVLMRASHNVNFSNSIFSKGLYGVLSWGTSSKVSLYRSCILGATYDGLILMYNTQTSIMYSTVARNGQHGVWLQDCNWGNITMSEFVNNTVGLNLDDCMYFKIWHNNFINNTVQAWDTYSNTWDDLYPSGGNYWSNFTVNDTKSGPFQDLPGSDGIGDNRFWLDPNSVDNYPLMTPVPEFEAVILPAVFVMGIVLSTRAFRRNRR